MELNLTRDEIKHAIMVEELFNKSCYQEDKTISNHYLGKLYNANLKVEQSIINDNVIKPNFRQTNGSEHK